MLIRFFRLLLTFHRFRLKRISHIVDSLLQMQESEIARSRDRSQKAKNKRQSTKNVKMKNVEMLNRREQAFQDSTAREFFRFERVEMKMTTKHDEIIDSKIEHAVHRADSVSDRRRRRERKRERERERRERRRRKRKRRDREQAVSK
jgi:hypothetical protein